MAADSRVVCSAWVGAKASVGVSSPEAALSPSWSQTPLFSRPESRQDYPLNLSILISGGKENNRDALSNGE